MTSGSRGDSRRDYRRTDRSDGTFGASSEETGCRNEERRENTYSEKYQPRGRPRRERGNYRSRGTRYLAEERQVSNNSGKIVTQRELRDPTPPSSNYKKTHKEFHFGVRRW